MLPTKRLVEEASRHLGSEARLFTGHAKREGFGELNPKAPRPGTYWEQYFSWVDVRIHWQLHGFQAGRVPRWSLCAHSPRDT